MEERRRGTRHVVTIPALVGSQGRFSFVTITKNVATSGLLVLSAVRLAVGERVVITYCGGPSDPSERSVEGHVVRVEPNEGERSGQFPYLAAIAFASPQPEIEQILESHRAASQDEEED